MLFPLSVPFTIVTGNLFVNYTQYMFFPLYRCSIGINPFASYRYPYWIISTHEVSLGLSFFFSVLQWASIIEWQLIHFTNENRWSLFQLSCKDVEPPSLRSFHIHQHYKLLHTYTSPLGRTPTWFTGRGILVSSRNYSYLSWGGFNRGFHLAYWRWMVSALCYTGTPLQTVNRDRIH